MQLRCIYVLSARSAGGNFDHLLFSAENSWFFWPDIKTPLKYGPSWGSWNFTSKIKNYKNGLLLLGRFTRCRVSWSSPLEYLFFCFSLYVHFEPLFWVLFRMFFISGNLSPSMRWFKGFSGSLLIENVFCFCFCHRKIISSSQVRKRLVDFSSRIPWAKISQKKPTMYQTPLPVIARLVYGASRIISAV